MKLTRLNHRFAWAVLAEAGLAPADIAELRTGTR
jgi:hypothetical protein